MFHTLETVCFCSGLLVLSQLSLLSTEHAAVKHSGLCGLKLSLSLGALQVSPQHPADSSGRNVNVDGRELICYAHLSSYIS